MTTRKKRLLLAVIVAFSFILVACGSNNSPSTASQSPNATPILPAEETAGDENTKSAEAAETIALETEEADVNEGNILIAYFSHTGNTKAVAQKIAEYTGGSLAEIQRSEAYGDLQEEAKAEILDGIHPQIKVPVDDMMAYDTIFVGYPIWWDEAPAMIATFLADNDFSGKTLIPFCTSASDDIGNSLHIFSELCPDAEILEGLTANDGHDIAPWLQRLGLME